MKTGLALGLTVSVLLITPSGAFAAGRPPGGPDAQPRDGASQQERGGSNNGPRAAALNEDTDGDGVANCPDPSGDADNRHPSGRDKHCEAGRSGVQGHSNSDPDGPANGGVDKPGGSGGRDLLDQDGNNGCGNDDDFEDDNNGRCLGRLQQQDRTPPDRTPPPSPGPGVEQPDLPRRRSVVFLAFVNNWHAIFTNTQTFALTGERSQQLTSAAGLQQPAAAVVPRAGSHAEVQPFRLARTGVSAAILALAAFLTLLAGLGLRSASRRVGRSPGM